MTGRAATGIRRAEADEQAAHNDTDESFERAQRGPSENLARRKPGEVVNAQFR
jgi:hypothetical protein